MILSGFQRMAAFSSALQLQHHQQQQQQQQPQLQPLLQLQQQQQHHHEVNILIFLHFKYFSTLLISFLVWL